MRRRNGGFVLVLVLAMLVVLSLLAGSIAATTARLLEQARQREQAMQDELDMASTRANVLYLLATQRMTVGGLTVEQALRTWELGAQIVVFGAPLVIQGDRFKAAGDDFEDQLRAIMAELNR